MKYFPSFSPLFPFLHSDPSPMKHRTVLSAALSASALLLLSAPAGATTTLYRFCSDSSDGSLVADNIAAAETAGWVISGKGSTTTAVGSGTYSNPMRVNTATTLTSPGMPSGTRIVSTTIGGRTSNTAGKYVVTPIYADGTTGTAIDAVLSSTGALLEIPVSFGSGKNVSSFRIAREGDGTMYLYYVKVDSLVILPTPANLDLVGDAGENEFTVSWGSVSGALSYSVTLLDALGGTVDSQSHTPSDRTATFSGLTSSTAYTVSVVAIGDHTATDDSAPKTLEVETAASSIAAPTLVVANTSWTAGVAGTSAVSATLAGGESCAFASVEMSDGSSATVDNGILSWTPPASTTASSVTATFHVTYDSNGWDIDQVLSVAATPAPGAPSLTLSNATAQSFDASWSSVGGPVVEYKIRAWTGRATPDDATGSASENFNDYLATTNVPTGWTFMNTKKPYNQEENPVDFRNNNEWVATPDYGGTITSLSFRLRRQSESGSTFKVYGSTGSADPDVWKTEENTLATLNPLATQVYTIPVDSSKGISRVFFQYTKASGNVSIGSFSVSGTDWPAADFLEGWGGAKVSVGTATLQTFSNPVPGTANYVEVTAIGPTGLSAKTIDSIAVPAAPRKPVLISIQ